MIISALFSRLIQTGELTIIDPSGTHLRFGPGGEPKVTIRIHDKGYAWGLLLNPSLWVGEAYMDGRLTIEQGTLYEFLHICTYQPEGISEPALQIARRMLIWPLRYLRQFNPIGRSRANVAHHYDLSGRLYDLFLDADRQYSCAYFADGTESLEQAQAKKKRHIASKLLLEPGMRVLDIGSGWGGLALYLAECAQVDVTGLTLSTEQFELAQRRVRKSGMTDRVRFELRDYRQETGTYDRIVSVGMFEHVGVPQYQRFFDQVRTMLKPDGVALIHSIGRMEPPGSTNAWIHKYIFPGGYSPALSEVMRAVEKSGLYVTDIEILRLHYADTLREWRHRFMASWDAASELYDERFCRMWEFFLAGYETAFRNDRQMVFQMQLSRNNHTVPQTRDYMIDWERSQALDTIKVVA
ncbi:MAG TPA: cyclopropane-fatty-acyl-phospholipid synthase family protein [Aliidongia sp.]|nr:cyclopropane-fatty-acyl-phospholipid synthase family protein [Aliidongia sp.]